MSDPDPTRADEQVRRLLADARHDEPMPADVADRLDGVLAGLQDEARRTPAPVDLSARRRRRVARNVLVAAAAVVVLGVGISRVDLSGQADEDGGSADSAGSAADAPESAAKSERQDLTLSGRPLVLRSQDFDRQVRRLRIGAVPNSLPRLLDEGYAADLSKDLDAAGRPWCANDPTWGSGRRIPVRYDGKRGVLVLRAPADGSRVADLYLCGQTVPARSTTVPAG